MYCTSASAAMDGCTVNCGSALGMMHQLKEMLPAHVTQSLREAAHFGRAPVIIYRAHVMSRIVTVELAVR